MLSEYANLIFLIGGMILNVTAIPVLLDSERSVPRVTSGMMAAVLTFYAFTYMSMNLPLASLSVAVGSVIWMAILVWRA
ncbi:hypothetical protein M1M34_gp094 [Haloarcula tailed virus 2]|uniref:Uncharacterized protein n=1 Tax=Haloarcula tailed virus 2 TaxID=2877989 RepID=A0AAE8Y0P1_9CAUD|nr:hypothetical protein M1M34_gp094 [Haloarcula tailed virus 2]UBF23239.1 hypothetical protein HATV-2_gp88 [Haloarcula tailed virus 2]